jgi:hypothetical protein
MYVRDLARWGWSDEGKEGTLKGIFFVEKTFQLRCTVLEYVYCVYMQTNCRLANMKRKVTE